MRMCPSGVVARKAASLQRDVGFEVGKPESQPAFVGRIDRPMTSIIERGGSERADLDARKGSFGASAKSAHDSFRDVDFDREQRMASELR